MKLLGFAIITAIAFAQAPAAMAQHGHDHGAKPVQQDQKAHDATGSVTRVDRSKGKATIKHGPVASLNWPGMTMGFDVKDPALFDKLKPGTKVDFSFVESGKGYVITQVK